MLLLRAEKLRAAAEAIARMSKDVADYPNPDLAIEVDLSPTKIDRAAIYAALRVAEVWRFEGERQLIVVERLGDDGAYHPFPDSAFLPVRSEEVRPGWSRKMSATAPNRRGACVSGSGQRWNPGDQGDRFSPFRLWIACLATDRPGRYCRARVHRRFLLCVRADTDMDEILTIDEIKALCAGVGIDRRARDRRVARTPGGASPLPRPGSTRGLS